MVKVRIVRAVLWLGATAACTPSKGADSRTTGRPAAHADLADAATSPPRPAHVELDASADVGAALVTDDDREQAAAEAMARAGKRGCAGQTRLIDARGEVMSCYPYRCRAGACLKRCRTRNDCVPSADPGESLAVKGWPILCGGHVPPAPNETAECLPLAPEDVHMRR